MSIFPRRAELGARLPTPLRAKLGGAPSLLSQKQLPSRCVSRLHWRRRSCIHQQWPSWRYLALLSRTRLPFDADFVAALAETALLTTVEAKSVAPGTARADAATFDAYSVGWAGSGWCGLLRIWPSWAGLPAVMVQKVHVASASAQAFSCHGPGS